MCERSTLEFEKVDRDIAADPRRVALYNWVSEDLRAGDRGLSRALAQWRDEMITRLPNRRFLKVRIPWIFVAGLQLPHQRVMLDANDAVYLVEDDKLNSSFGRLLVPGQNRPE